MCSTRNLSGKFSEGGKLVAKSSADGHTLAASGATTRENGGAALGLHASPEAMRLNAAATVRLKCALRHKTALLLAIAEICAFTARFEYILSLVSHQASVLFDRLFGGH